MNNKSKTAEIYSRSSSPKFVENNRKYLPNDVLDKIGILYELIINMNELFKINLPILPTIEKNNNNTLRIEDLINQLKKKRMKFLQIYHSIEDYLKNDCYLLSDQTIEKIIKLNVFYLKLETEKFNEKIQKVYNTYNSKNRMLKKFFHNRRIL